MPEAMLVVFLIVLVVVAVESDPIDIESMRLV
jgi:hypothetical protein